MLRFRIYVLDASEYVKGRILKASQLNYPQSHLRLQNTYSLHISILYSYCTYYSGLAHNSSDKRKTIHQRCRTLQNILLCQKHINVKLKCEKTSNSNEICWKRRSKFYGLRFGMARLARKMLKPQKVGLTQSQNVITLLQTLHQRLDRNQRASGKQR